MKISKLFEYTPFLGIIPGAIRLSAVKDSNAKAKRVAANFLHVDYKSNYSKGREILRGIISCIPFVNLILIPLDCAGAFKVSKIIQTDVVVEEELHLVSYRKFAAALVTLDQFYMTDVVVRDVSHELEKVFHVTDSLEGGIKTISNALKDAYENAIKIYGPVIDAFQEEGEEEEDFNMITFIQALKFVKEQVEKEQEDKALQFVKCEEDYDNSAAKYLKMHCHNAERRIIHEIDPSSSTEEEEDW